MVFIENDRMDPYYNLALEAFIFEKTDWDACMLWRDDRAIVCGCSQNIFAEVNIRAALSCGVTLCRRDSGGGAVYHDAGNINYTIIRSSVDGDGYDAFIKPVVTALNRMGIPAQMNRLCDIALDGLKISGSAQRVKGQRVMHHGTLLYDVELDKLRTLSNGRREGFSRRGMASKPFPVTNIRPSLPDRPDTLTFMRRLRAFLCADMPIYRLKDKERAAAEALAVEKYARWPWIYGRSPAFDRECAFIYDNKGAAARLSVSKGVICDLTFDMDMPRASRLRQALIGQPLAPDLINDVRTQYAEFSDLLDRII